MSTLAGSVIPQLMVDEGFRRLPYRCTAGRLTIGYGTNLDAGITDDEAMFLLDSRVVLAVHDCQRAFAPWFAGLSLARRGVLVQMVYQMGLARVRGFRRMLAACARGEFDTAAVEMLDSKWATTDSPARAQRHAATMRRG